MAETARQRRWTGPRGLLAVFALSVFAPALVLAVLAYGGVAKERRALTAERAGDLTAAGTRIRLGLADALDELRRTEENRPWYHFNPFYFEPGQMGSGLNFQPSPLVTGTQNPLVQSFSWFQIAPDGKVSSPVPTQPEQQRAQVLNAAPERRDEAEFKDRVGRSNDVVAEIQEKLAPQVQKDQTAVVADGKGKFRGMVDDNRKQWINRRGAVANQQTEEDVQALIAGKKKELSQTKNVKGPESELLEVEVSPYRFEALPESGILAYRFVDAPNETDAYGGVPILRYVQGFKLDLDRVRGKLFPDLVDRDLGVGGATAALLAEGAPTQAGRVAFEEAVALLPGHRLVVVDTDPGWVTGRVSRLSLFLIGTTALLLLVIAGGVTFTMRAVKDEVDLAQRKSDFVAAVTHELRTPLTGIKMYADMLQAGWVKNEETRDEYVGFMAAETDRLARLVNRVLDFARSERGKAETAPVRLEDPIREVERDFGPYVAEKGFDLSIRIETERDALADRDAVKQILLNLLENAVKYATDAEDREIAVTVRDRGPRVALEVADHGPGVPAAEREKIFTDFYRPGEELTREAPGAGLGLALVRRLAVAMGGETSVHETPGGGATFTVTLPA
jgi:signal transduction histidine kinase